MRYQVLNGSLFYIANFANTNKAKIINIVFLGKGEYEALLEYEL